MEYRIIELANIKYPTLIKTGVGFKIIGVANKVLNFVKDRIDYFF